MPRAISWAACPLIDNMQTTLRISCPEPGSLEIVDKTKFGRNATRVTTDGIEVEKQTRNGRKTFMLSAPETTTQSSVLSCRLTSRGPGWYTRQERELCPDGSLVERHVLVRPLESDIVVSRYFTKDGDESLEPEKPCTAP